MGIDTTVIPLNASAVKADILATVGSDINLLGEIRQFALSIAGALTKSQLQAKGWAICDGTTPSSQGISDPTITTTPDLREKFLRHSADETTGGTGGASTVTLDLTQIPSHNHLITASRLNTGTGSHISGGWTSGTNADVNTGNRGGGLAHENKPPYYDICYFIKVKV